MISSTQIRIHAAAVKINPLSVPAQASAIVLHSLEDTTQEVKDVPPLISSLPRET
jgi:hypothetical protein